MSLREWFRPPRHLLAVLLLLTAASVSALLWSGWKLTEQESAVEAQRGRERLEQAADRIAALLRANLAETGERLAATASSPAGITPEPGQSLLLLLTRDALCAYPPGRLLYAPAAERGPEAPASAFAEGEAAEIQHQQLDRAAAIYRRMSETKDRALQAGALMRLARVLRRSGQTEEARAAYQRLSRLEGVRAAGAPADLVARHALCDLSCDSAERMRLHQDLLAGRWALTRGQFEFYWADSVRHGFDVCRELRRGGHRTPILMLTAKTQEAEKVLGLELGADDYVTKPFGTRELRARIKALLRRAGGDEQDRPHSYRFGDVEVDFRRGELRRGGNAVEATPLELKLLGAFIRARGRVLSRDQLMNAAWGHGTFASARVVDNHIANLRKKIEPDPAEPRYPRNVRGLGYRFDG